jgi:hypothetical protein
MAGGALAAFQQFGYLVGVAALGAVFAHRVEMAIVTGRPVPGGSRLAGLLTGGQAQAAVDAAPSGQRAAVEELSRAAFASGLRWMFLAAGATALVGAVVTVVLTWPRSAHGKHEAGLDRPLELEAPVALPEPVASPAPGESLAARLALVQRMGGAPWVDSAGPPG